MKNQTSNKGFSLVELIVVIAIMAILVGIMAPSLMKQIDKSRLSKDTQQVDTILSAINNALADEEIYDKTEMPTDGDDLSTWLGANEELSTDVLETLKKTAITDVTFTSKNYKGLDAGSITVETDDNENVTLTLTSTKDDSKSIVIPKSSATN